MRQETDGGPRKLIEAASTARSSRKSSMIYGGILGVVIAVQTWFQGNSKWEFVLIVGLFSAVLIAEFALFGFIADLRNILNGFYEDQRELLLQTASELREETKAGLSELCEELKDLKEEVRSSS